MSEPKPQVSEPKPKRKKVHVLNMRGKPLMPCSPVKARKLLQANKAVVKHREPFTIQLTVASGENRQDITLGVDNTLVLALPRKKTSFMQLKLTCALTSRSRLLRDASYATQDATSSTSLRQPCKKQEKRLACAFD